MCVYAKEKKKVFVTLTLVIYVPYLKICFFLKNTHTLLHVDLKKKKSVSAYFLSTLVFPFCFVLSLAGFAYSFCLLGLQ